MPTHHDDHESVDTLLDVWVVFPDYSDHQPTDGERITDGMMLLELGEADD